ncbi:MAG: hypothetical protein KR126chlam5_01299 [Candidatus Anoxychlamydiales bacterium]|nr:hypothetical protein [Candidatus Anoxychlamydiales bacterium]
MNRLAFKYFKKDQNSGFDDVIVVDPKTHTFDDLQKLTKNFPKAWHELSSLSLKDRVDFSTDFCLKTLPYTPNTYQLIYDFFLKLEDVSVVLTKKKNHPYKVELVYSMQNDSTFFRGQPPLDDETISQINAKFKNVLPRDFLKFLKIHSGFAKNSDTGILEAENIFEITNHLRELTKSQNKTIKSDSSFIDPNDLIFFYQSFDQMDFQCFLASWYPISEMGNVSFSYVDSTISSYKNSSFESLSFPTFLDWLMFYLEVIDLNDL